MLLPGLVTSAFVLVMAGGEVMATGYWGWGMMWGFGVLIMLGGTFWLSRLSSPAWALTIVVLFYAVLLIGSQVAYFDLARDRLHRTVADAESGRFPAAWQNLGRDDLYRRWMADVLDEPDASGWWAHLRSQARVGISHAHLAMEFKEGEPAYRPVFRQGGQLWLNWGASLFMVGVGCLFSLIGCAVWNSRVIKGDRDRAFSEGVIEEVSEVLEQRGLAQQQIRSIVRTATKETKPNTPIPLQKVAELLPDLEPSLVREIRGDLEINRQWIHRSVHELELDLDPERTRLAEAVIQRYYHGRTDILNPRNSGLLIVIAAHRLHEAVPAERFWFSLERIVSVHRALGYRDRIQHFSELDLSGISFRRVPVGPGWKLLASRVPKFFAWGSGWQELEQMSTEEIPEQAYLAIIYQSYFMPDPRTYEGWYGVAPNEIEQRLGPKLRDALLTFIETEAPRMRGEYKATRFASMADHWPFDIAAPIMERALQAGWNASVAGVPETDEWYQFLERYAHSPFGDLRDSVRWYKMRSRKETK